MYTFLFIINPFAMMTLKDMYEVGTGGDVGIDKTAWVVCDDQSFSRLDHFLERRHADYPQAKQERRTSTRRLRWGTDHHSISFDSRAANFSRNSAQNQSQGMALSLSIVPHHNVGPKNVQSWNPRFRGYRQQTREESKFSHVPSTPDC